MEHTSESHQIMRDQIRSPQAQARADQAHAERRDRRVATEAALRQLVVAHEAQRQLQPSVAHSISANLSTGAIYDGPSGAWLALEGSKERVFCPFRPISRRRVNSKPTKAQIRPGSLLPVGVFELRSVVCVGGKTAAGRMAQSYLVTETIQVGGDSLPTPSVKVECVRWRGSTPLPSAAVVPDLVLESIAEAFSAAPSYYCARPLDELLGELGKALSCKEDAVSSLVTTYQPVVTKVAKAVARQMGSQATVDQDDIQSLTSKALLRGIDAFVALPLLANEDGSAHGPTRRPRTTLEGWLKGERGHMLRDAWRLVDGRAKVGGQVVRLNQVRLDAVPVELVDESEQPSISSAEIDAAYKCLVAQMRASGQGQLAGRLATALGSRKPLGSALVDEVTAWLAAAPMSSAAAIRAAVAA